MVYWTFSVIYIILQIIFCPKDLGVHVSFLFESIIFCADLHLKSIAWYKWIFCVRVSATTHTNIMVMTTGAFSYHLQTMQRSSHIVDMFVYERHYGIWHGWNVLTISKVKVLASWGGAENGTGWELAVCPSLYMRAWVTMTALCQIMGLSRGQYLSLLVLGEYLGCSGHTAVPSFSALDTQASSKTVCVGVHVFLSMLIFVLTRVCVPV